ncbi:uncharacterized protein LOC100891241 isoform X2 [Strongylocentrotus purpuratus]|uniref:DSBA-like thioredoxin domain-containing protein n=1 Tax=Strongylocentrotus purpuratus TaxID=7668 RepID=A0A7M7LW94_STRPU|nr:uncharacterized protein LOC100891241 isoform X2 [Strongylocentrotus purpuratus]|eukprot:XP_011675549.1 PREDICTED: uncharacterized protein LOC100891241 isoform X2 [Strongylocentrotus purpuratus]
MFILVVSAIVLGCNLAPFYASAQAPIPESPPGFVYKSTSPDVPILLEAWVDLICPDAKGAWLTYQEVADHYGTDTVRFSALMFPLPYDRAAMKASQGSFVARDMNPALVYAWFNNVFDKQAALYDNAIYDKTTEFIDETLATWASEVGYDKDQFQTRLNRSDPAHSQARVEFKYGATRGVFGTPQTYVNGAVVYSDSSWTLADWRNIIDPLISGNRVRRRTGF